MSEHSGKRSFPQQGDNAENPHVIRPAGSGEPVPVPAPGERLSGADVEAEVGHASNESLERVGQPANASQPAGAETAALRLQHSGGSENQPGADFDETRTEVESVISQNPG